MSVSHINMETPPREEYILCLFLYVEDLAQIGA